MGKKRLMFFLPVSLLLLLILTACSGEDVQPTSTSDAIFTYIEWPEKYEGDGGTLYSDPFRVDISKFQSLPAAFCWATYSHRESVNDAEPDPFATEFQEVSESGSFWFTLPYYELGRTALDGVYTIRIGLCEADSNYLFESRWAAENDMYNKYVGAAHYRHDVVFEYIWQSSGWTDYDVFDRGNWEDMTKPLRNTLVHFAKVDCDSNPVSPERIRSTAAAMDDYVGKYAATWPGHPDLRKYRYFLCGVEAMIDPGSGIELDVLGMTDRDRDLCFVAVGKIEEKFNYYLHEINMAVAAHEFGFAIGAGQPAFCEFPDSHAVDFDCLMGGLLTDPNGYPGWGCPGDSTGNPFNGNAQFCPDCIQRLNNLDFLTVDY